MEGARRGCWVLGVGRWRLAVGYWLLAVGRPGTVNSGSNLKGLTASNSFHELRILLTECNVCVYTFVSPFKIPSSNNISTLTDPEA